MEAERESLRARTRVEIDDDDDAEPMDGPDKASEEVDRRERTAISDRGQLRLAELESALARLIEGTYGICEETDEIIPFARLCVEPTTRYSVEALEMLEEERARERAQGHGDDDSAY